MHEQAYVKEDIFYQLLQQTNSAIDMLYAQQAMRLYRKRPGKLRESTINLYITKLLQVHNMTSHPL